MASASLQQRTPAWHAARKGKLTASNIGAVLGLCPWTTRLQAFNRAMGLDKFQGRAFNEAVEPRPLSAFRRYVCGVGNDATKWGTANEANGILAYSAHTGNVVENTGLHVHPTVSWLAGSPDGLIGTEGLLEVKCPYWRKKDGSRCHKEVPAHYYMQMNLCLEVTQREWCDFVSWSPDDYKIYRVFRDSALHEQMLPHYLKFFAAMQRMAQAPPVLSDAEKSAIQQAVHDSMELNINYCFWDRVDLVQSPPEDEMLEVIDEEPESKRARMTLSE